ncbi:NAD-specific glutamate dehydrogenase [compost metagenome]
MRFALAEAVRQLPAELLHILQAAPHQALDRDDGVQRVFGCVLLHRVANLHMIGEVAHRGRQDHAALFVGQGFGDAAAHGSDQRIGGAQVDPHGQTTLVRLGALSGFGDLQ